MGFMPILRTDKFQKFFCFFFFKKRSSLLSLVFSLFLFLGFFLPTESAWADVFYVCVAPVILWRLSRERFSPVWILPLLLIGWSILTVAWCDHPGRNNSSYLVRGLMTALFYLGLSLALARGMELTRVLGVAAGLDAVWALARYDWAAFPVSRLSGLGETAQLTLGASVMAVAALVALDRGLRKAHWGWFGLTGLLSVYVLLSGSRGAMAGLVAGLAVLLVRRWFVLLAGVATGLLLLGRHGAQSLLTGRGDSFRLVIWKASLARIAERPWFGHGMGAVLGFGQFTFPHDLFLSLLFYSGLVGLALFVAMAMVLWGGVWRHGSGERALLIALWVNMLVAGLSDDGQIIKGPSELWYLIWLPVAHSSAVMMRAREQAARDRLGKARAWG